MRSLAERLAHGEESAFAELYGACADRLYAFAVARLGSPEEAADVVQTTFMRVVTQRQQFRGVEYPVAYVFQIARHEAARTAHQRRRRPTNPLENAEEVVDPRSQLSREDAEAARAALARLTEDERVVVELKVYAGLTFQEIAAATGQPQGTAATRYRRSLASLRGWLERQYR
jgi:RNA polymerase sigma-70 factor (ECF subfamily)